MHQSAETRLINLWIILILVAWVSATNYAHFYNTALGIKDGVDNVGEVEWAFGGNVTPNHVYTGFTILFLLEDCEEHSTRLVVPHTGEEGEEKDYYNATVAAVNHRWRITQKRKGPGCKWHWGASRKGSQGWIWPKIDPQWTGLCLALRYYHLERDVLRSWGYGCCYCKLLSFPNPLKERLFLYSQNCRSSSRGYS